MWIGSQDSRLAQEVPLQWDRARKEAEDFQSKYEKDVQFIFSHVQHHWHALDQSGKRVPLPYCRVKGRKGKPICKMGYPKKVLRNDDGSLKQEKYRARIVCQGVAAELDLKTTGRRNALGSVVGRRRCAYFASTSALLAHVARSSTNVQCNYRVPITTATHDKDCKVPKSLEFLTRRNLCLIAQRAMKQMTGYFGGYISKRQKMGQFELKKSVSALSPLQEKLQNRDLKTASAQVILFF